MKQFLRVLFSCILCLFLAIFTFADKISDYAIHTILNPGFLVESAEKSGYAQQVYDEIVYEWENLLSITGVETPEDIMVILTPELVEKDALGYISDSTKGSATLDTKELRNALNGKVRTYAYSHNIYATPTEELEQNISDLVDACMDEYESAITVPMLPRILGQIYGYTSLIPDIILISAVGYVLILLFLFFLQTKRENILYYMSISTATSAVIFVAIPYLAAHYDIVNRIPFAESSLRTLIATYLQDLLDAMAQQGGTFLQRAAIVLGVFIVLSVIFELIRYFRNKKAQEKIAE